MRDLMSTPRKNTSMRRTRVVIVVIFAAIALASSLTGCGVEPGRVTGMWISCTGKPVQCHPWMSTKTSDGDSTEGPITWREYMRCHKGDRYPACAKKGR